MFNPCDVIKADASGIVVVPRDHLSDVIDRLGTQKERQQSYLDSVRRGEFSNEWVDQLLTQQDCESID